MFRVEAFNWLMSQHSTMSVSNAIRALATLADPVV
jgi:hypothetical protein